MNAAEINQFYNAFYKLNLENNSYNPDLRISKATDSKMKIYKINKLKCVIYRKNVVKFFLPGIILFRIFINGLYNIFRFALYQKQKTKVNKVDIVFVSHLTNRNSNSMEDTFYGPIPQELRNSGKNVAIIYSNQIRGVSKTRIKNIESNNNFVIPKYLEFKEFVEFFKTALKSVKFTFEQVTSIPELQREENTLVFKACYSFFKVDTMMNFHLIEKTKEVVLKYQPKYVFITLEGHIYENSISLYCENNPDINQIFIFQNSPISPSQFGLFDFVKESREKLTYLVQGNTYKELILKLNKSSQVMVVGKKEEIFNLKQEDKSIENNKLILVPDGDKLNISYFLHLSKSFYDQVSKDIEITLHPDTHIGIGNHIKLFILKRKGLIKKTKSNLKTQDLALYGSLAYTSSSLSIKSLRMGIQLIYVNDSKYNLDPLWLSSPIESVQRDDKTDFKPRYFQITEYRNYCSELNYQPLIELITT